MANLLESKSLMTARLARAGGRVLSCAVLLMVSHTALAQDAAVPKWSIAPYLWASQTKVDLTLRDQSLGGGTIEFRDLVDQLDSAFMVNVEAGQGRWSVFADVTYLETSDRQQRPVFLVDSASQMTALDTGLAYWPNGFGSDLSVIAGVRYNGFDNRYQFYLGDTPVTRARDSDDYYDALLGLRYRFDLSGPWELITRADFSLGQSEGSWMLRASFARKVGRRGLNRVVFGYQYKQAEFTSGDLRTEYAYHGPTAAFNFRF